MKGLSVKEPFASLIADGRKSIETRGWRTDYRGPLLICASAKPKIHKAGYAVCIVTLFDVRKMHIEDAGAAMCDYIPGRYAWILTNLHRFGRPMPAKGALYLWDVDAELVAGWKTEIEYRYRCLYGVNRNVETNSKQNQPQA